MKTFVFGEVLEPEVKTIAAAGDKSSRKLVNFGFLVGKRSHSIDVWQDSEVYEKALMQLHHGDEILAIVDCVATDRGYVRNFLIDFVPAPDDIREALKDAFANPVAASAGSTGKNS